MNQTVLVAAFLLIHLFSPSLGAAQESPPMELGVMTGRLLPDQVDGVTEIMTLTGGHIAYRLSSMWYAQSHLLAGKGLGQSWKSVSLGVRYDLPLEDFLVSVYGGAQSVFSSGPGFKEKNEWGGMAGGAFWFSTGGPTWLKLDMNFGFGPGTTLYISLGLIFRF